MQPAAPRPRRRTVADNERPAELGFFDGRRAELVDGRIVEMPAMRNEHAVGLALTGEVLSGVFAAGFWVRTQMPLRQGKHSAPEPDLAVVPGHARDYQAHPTTALLVVEERHDPRLRPRPQGQALRGGRDRGVLDRKPRRATAGGLPRPAPRRADYRLTILHEPGELVSPLAAPDRTVNVSDLLP